ncbi:hypothetical protein Q604_UNBC10634G0001, partial [human gut metagenome]
IYFDRAKLKDGTYRDEIIMGRSIL